MKKRKKCYIYVRVSTAMQVDGYSLEAQKDRLQNGIPVEANTLAELRRIAAELGIEGV